jgi:hypothetical protein
MYYPSPDAQCLTGEVRNINNPNIKKRKQQRTSKANDKRPHPSINPPCIKHQQQQLTHNSNNPQSTLHIEPSNPQTSATTHNPPCILNLPTHKQQQTVASLCEPLPNHN